MPEGATRAAGALGTRFAGIGDEAGQSLREQIEAHRRLGWSGIELRNVDGTALADLDDAAFQQVVGACRSAGLDVVCVDSRIGNWARPITSDFDVDLRELEVLAERCAMLGARLVRVMSYPNDGLEEGEWRARALERLRVLAERAERAGLVLVHENCAGWAADRPDRMRELVEEIASPALRLLFDIGNGPAYGYSGYDLLAEVVDLVSHVHVKDGVGSGEETAYTLPGEGDCRVADCLSLLRDAGYGGTLSIEPHLRVQPHQGQLDPGADGLDTFVAYGRHLERLVSGLAAAQPAPNGAGDFARDQAARGATQDDAAAALSPADIDLLCRLLELPTAGPLETGDDGPPPQLWAAGSAYATSAAALGFEVVRHAPAAAADLVGVDVPRSVDLAMAADPEFLDCQPSLVLRLGPPRPRARTIMFNVHLDTVAGEEPVSFDGARFHGRGAVDAKGPAVALLAGARAALEAHPRLADDVTIIIQAVAGEEGGAMGVFGTRPLVEAGHVGRLNLFCEPTGRRLLARATAAMTACVRVDGEDAIDDRPEAGHNATVLLGALAQHLAEALPPLVPDARVCIAGLRTGPLHNRVYGRGQLLLNLAYDTMGAAARLERAVSEQCDVGLALFRQRFGDSPLLGRTAREAEEITTLEWHKRGLPVLDADDAWAEDVLLGSAGLRSWPRDEPAFTCDAIWAGDQPEAFTGIYGPGDLDANNAHASGEHVDLEELELFAGDVARVLGSFARAAAPSREVPA